MSNYRLPSSSPHALHTGRLGGLNGHSGAGGVPLAGIPFVIRCPFLGADATDTIIAAGALQHDFEVIDAWCVISTAGGDADEDADVRTVGGAAGGDLLVRFSTGASAAGVRLAPDNVDGTSTSVAQAVTANATNGIFIDKTGTTFTAIGTIYLLCVRP